MNTQYPTRLHFYIVQTDSNDTHDILRIVHCPSLFDSKSKPKISIVQFNASLIASHIVIHGDPKYVKRLYSAANYARLYFHDLLPNVDKAIYIDLDMIVQGDVVELWDADLNGNLLGVVLEEKMIGYWFLQSSSVSSYFKARYYVDLDMTTLGYNAGLYVIDLAQWRRRNLLEEALYWMGVNAKEALWIIGTQPLMYLVSYRNYTPLDPAWNAAGFGTVWWDAKGNATLPGQSKGLHWNGAVKPWEAGALRREYWTKYGVIGC